MKTLRNTKTGELKRVHDKEAQKLFLQTYLGWEYCPKNVWKTEMGTAKSTETALIPLSILFSSISSSIISIFAIIL